MPTKFYIVKPEYSRPSDDVPFSITGVEFLMTANETPAPRAHNTYASANEHANHLYKNCGWIAPLVVCATAETARERREIARAKALDCYAGKITSKQARRP